MKLVMQSQLTFIVFRRLLTGEGLIFHSNTRSGLFTRRCNRQANPQCFRRCLRRSIFGFAQNIVQQPRGPSITPGLPKMMELSHMCKIGARPPLATELKKSWHIFFDYKIRNKEIVNRLQVSHALRTYEHLKNLNSSDISESLNLAEISLASKALRRLPDDKTDHHYSLAKSLYNEIQERETDASKTKQALRYYIETLSLTGNTTEARELLQANIIELKESSTSEQDGIPPDILDKLWLFILKGFAREKNEAELLRTYDIASEHGVVYHPVVHRVMTSFFAEKDAILQTKYWYNKPIIARGNSSPYPRPQTLATVLQFCLRNNELDWCKDVFREALSLNPSKGTWDVVFLWAAGAMGKGVEDVERMIGVMIRRNPDNEVFRPNIHTINGLVKLAMSKNDPYLAERYLILGLKYGIRPNARTLILQLNYRCDAKDLRGARAAYDALQAEEVIDDEDLPPINKYIRSICDSPEPDFDLTLTLINDLDERGKRLEASTVTALSNIYLQRGEIDGLVNILQNNIYHYTLSERGSIRDTFVKFCCNRYNSTLKAWDAYNILRQFFNETAVEQRTHIMNSFFERRRCDMACHTFGHMRQNTIQDRKPRLETYVSCLEGIAKLANHEYLDIVHNMLKLDHDIEPNTTLYNALMLAYTSICEGGRALSFWKDITSRYEGPNYKSLEIFFWACQESNEGSIEARKVYEKMNTMGVELTAPILAEYMGSLAKDACWLEVKALIQSVEQEHGLKPDVRMLGTVYNCLPGDDAKAIMEAWSIEHYLEIWNELRKFGRRMVRHKQFPEIRMRQFYIKRDFKAS